MAKAQGTPPAGQTSIQDSPIGAQLERMEKSLDELDKAVTDLEGRLSPIVNPEVPSRDIESGPTPASSVACSISNDAERVERATARVVTLLDAVEL